MDQDSAATNQVIDLEEVTVEEFRAMEQWWDTKKSPPKKFTRTGHADEKVFMRIVNPLEYRREEGDSSDYETLFDIILNLPYARKIKVNDGKKRGWWTLKPNDAGVIDASRKESIAEVANSDHFKRNYLELIFNAIGEKSIRREGRVREVPNEACIGFIEYQGRIIGYEAEIPGKIIEHQADGILRPRLQPDTKYVALWVPESVGREIIPHKYTDRKEVPINLNVLRPTG